MQGGVLLVKLSYESQSSAADERENWRQEPFGMKWYCDVLSREIELQVVLMVSSIIMAHIPSHNNFRYILLLYQTKLTSFINFLNMYICIIPNVIITSTSHRQENRSWCIFVCLLCYSFQFTIMIYSQRLKIPYSYFRRCPDMALLFSIQVATSDISRIF